MSDTENMNDEQLAEWQAGWKEHTGNYILAEREWERRMISHEFSLQTKLAAINNRWLIASAFIGVFGTLAGAWLGAHFPSTNLVPAAQSKQVSVQQLQPPPNVEQTKLVQPALQKLTKTEKRISSLILPYAKR